MMVFFVGLQIKDTKENDLAVGSDQWAVGSGRWAEGYSDDFRLLINVLLGLIHEFIGVVDHV
jgi:hypothetical protein